VRDEFDDRAKLEEAEQHENETGHERGHCQAGHTVSLDDRVDDHHERASRPSDLDTRSAECGDQEAGDDGGVEPLGRRHAARDTERDRKWQGHDANDHARGQVVRELPTIVPAERRDQLWDEHGSLVRDERDR
jgi:hypothetical protein